jgi:hypothetical protein
MDLISLLLVLVVVGVVLWLIETYLPLSPPIKTIIRVVVVIVLILWLVQLFIGPVRVPIGRGGG